MTVHLTFYLIISFQNACSFSVVDRGPIEFRRIMDILSPSSFAQYMYNCKMQIFIRTTCLIIVFASTARFIQVHDLHSICISDHMDRNRSTGYMKTILRSGFLLM